VTIEVMTASPEGGTFTTSGAGLCPSGTTSDQVFGTPPQGDSHANFHDLKTFTCADGSGTFTANVQAHFIFGSPTDSFTWNILSGTGAYTNLHGSGSGVGDELETAVNDHSPARCTSTDRGLPSWEPSQGPGKVVHAV
jgi:hypothetical protein